MGPDIWRAWTVIGSGAAAASVGRCTITSFNVRPQGLTMKPKTRPVFHSLRQDNLFCFPLRPDNLLCFPLDRTPLHNAPAQ